nr:MAG TPA: hypothetical protein [Caudoviricetes sp.]DAY69541.1 MAG TPA: hypothetical protein [Caudoviricetes sp.]
MFSMLLCFQYGTGSSIFSFMNKHIKIHTY